MEGPAAPVATPPMAVYKFAELMIVLPTRPTSAGSLSCLIGYLNLSTCAVSSVTWIVTSVQLVWIDNKFQQRR
jgi:hypothetical protein